MSTILECKNLSKKYGRKQALDEHLNVPLIVEGEQPDDQLPQGLLASNPGHETVQGVSPPSSGRRVCAVSSRSRVRSSPRMAAAIPLIRLVRWAMVARTSWSVAA